MNDDFFREAYIDYALAMMINAATRKRRLFWLRSMEEAIKGRSAGQAAKMERGMNLVR